MLMQLPLFLAQPAGGAQGGSSSLLSMAPILIMILIFYFLIMRPQSKKQKETKKMLEAVKKGDKVTTIGGIRGTVDSVKDDVVSVRVDGSTKIDFVKSAISTVSNPVVDAQVKDTKEK
ncbi:MAG: preprotein translocase subunit YajC [Spirochaetaceae bacterium 4572_7]|nr:MAG: preprotein translocase subunit YajC [Spirochaetaceae bacterium 4572_7]